ncbi:Autoinducer synthesis protein SolI [plant metagenome]|uniref:Autoinducer synthesis protein SolI n=1 Tax=plant metagenome TaxID=1297885 RepID=A0A484PU75_9ZZZZ
MEILAGTPDHLPPGLMSGLARYRHRVFVEMLGWKLPCEGGLEFDQFDRPDTLYVAARCKRSGRLVGSARLLPTNRPYLLGEIFPDLMQGIPVPHSEQVWELSRFAAVDFSAPPQDGPAGQFSSPVAVELLRVALAAAAEHGARRLITVSPLGVERLLRRAGFQARRAAPPILVDGHALFACWIEVPRPNTPPQRPSGRHRLPGLVVVGAGGCL